MNEVPTESARGYTLRAEVQGTDGKATRGARGTPARRSEAIASTGQAVDLTARAGRGISRRKFLALSGAAAATAATGLHQGGLAFLSAAPGITDPLLAYPNRGWERVYRDQYAYDSSFTFVCAPNDTHMCRLRAFVRNGIVLRTEQNYDAGNYRDPQGNSSSVGWNPRGCLKGYTIQRRLYGPYRLKYPLVRAGWKAWADASFPSLSDQPELRTPTASTLAAMTISCASAGTRSTTTSRAP